MLERPSLAIDAERAASDGFCRTIRDAETAEELGLVVRAAASPWWQPLRLSVVEGPDSSLLMTVRRRWLFGATDVCDADGKPLALIRGRWVEGLDGRSLAGRSRRDGIYRLNNGVEVATVSRRGDVTDLRFHPRVAGEPLLKMALLAAALQ